MKITRLDVGDVLCASSGLYIKFSDTKQLHFFQPNRLIVSSLKWKCREHLFVSDEDKSRMGETIYRMIKAEPVEIDGGIYFVETSKDLSFLSCFRRLQLKLKYFPSENINQMTNGTHEKREKSVGTFGNLNFNYPNPKPYSNRTLTCSKCYATL